MNRRARFPLIDWLPIFCTSAQKRAKPSVQAYWTFARANHYTADLLADCETPSCLPASMDAGGAPADGRDAPLQPGHADQPPAELTPGDVAGVTPSVDIDRGAAAEPAAAAAMHDTEAMPGEGGAPNEPASPGAVEPAAPGADEPALANAALKRASVEEEAPASAPVPPADNEEPAAAPAPSEPIDDVGIDARNADAGVDSAPVVDVDGFAPIGAGASPAAEVQQQEPDRDARASPDAASASQLDDEDDMVRSYSRSPLPRAPIVLAAGSTLAERSKLGCPHHICQLDPGSLADIRAGKQPQHGERTCGPSWSS
jgi:hypothetical protein